MRCCLQNCVFGNTADGVWLGSSEQLVSSMSNIALTQRNFLNPVMPAVQIHLLHTDAYNQTQRKTNTEHDWLPFSLLSLYSSSSTSTFSSATLPSFPKITFYSSFPFQLRNNCILLWLPASFAPSHFSFSSSKIAVVSYGFLFLRDGRWVHVGVEATKHAVSAQHAGQHMQRASCGYDSCHAHISVLPIIQHLHTVQSWYRLKTVLLIWYYANRRTSFETVEYI